jgi:hypothetical protein
MPLLSLPNRQTDFPGENAVVEPVETYRCDSSAVCMAKGENVAVEPCLPRLFQSEKPTGLRYVFMLELFLE